MPLEKQSLFFLSKFVLGLTTKNKVQMVLISIPVDICKKIRSGGLIMKFPSKEYKQKANTAFEGCFEQDPPFLVSEPRKLKLAQFSILLQVWIVQ